MYRSRITIEVWRSAWIDFNPKQDKYKVDVHNPEKENAEILKVGQRLEKFTIPKLTNATMWLNTIFPKYWKHAIVLKSYNSENWTQRQFAEILKTLSYQ